MTVPRRFVQSLQEGQPPADPALVPAQQFRRFHLRQAVFPHQGEHDPRLFQFLRVAAGAVQAVDRRLRRPLVRDQQPRAEFRPPRQRSRRCQPLEAVQDLRRLLAQTDHDRRDLAVPVERPRQGRFRGGVRQTIAAVSFAEQTQRHASHVSHLPVGHGPSPELFHPSKKETGGGTESAPTRSFLFRGREQVTVALDSGKYVTT